MSAINDEQCKWIESLTCERLSDNFDNQDVIIDFDNKYDTLVSHLHENAIKEDENNSGAYYLVKSKDCKALFYFSLRCGLLYEDVLNSDLVEFLQAFGLGHAIVDKHSIDILHITQTNQLIDSCIVAHVALQIRICSAPFLGCHSK